MEPLSESEAAQDAGTKDSPAVALHCTCCVSLPLTPGLAQMLENAAQIALKGGDKYVRIQHVEAALGMALPPPKIEKRKPAPSGRWAKKKPARGGTCQK